MGFDDIIRAGVGIADRLTASVQVTIYHEAYASQDAYRKPTYGTRTPRQVVLEYATKASRATTGAERTPTASFVVPRATAFDVRDRITLPDGRVAPVVKLEAVPDPQGGVFATRVWVG